MHPIALALALLIPLVIDCALLAEVVPEVLVAEESSKEKEKAIKEIQRLTRAVEKAEEAGNDQQAIEIL